MTTTPPLRADAARNRQAVLDAAARAFSTGGDASVRAVAREAGVGVGTLYRHFPTREALVDAVYADQVRRLVDGARELLAELPPVEALRRWMDLFAEWMATKHGMLDTLRAMVDAGQIVHARSRGELLEAVTVLLEAGAAAGDLRDDVPAEDVVVSLTGTFSVASGPDRAAQSARLLDLLVDGLRARRG